MSQISITFEDKHISALLSALECALRLRLKQFNYALEAVFPDGLDILGEMSEDGVFNLMVSLTKNLPDTKDNNWYEIYTIWTLLRQYTSYRNNNWERGFGVNYDSPDILGIKPLPKIEGWDSKNGVRES